jgi:hypothetical protein
MSKSIWISCYSNKDRKAVASLKRCLEGIGFEVFVAHEDMEPRTEWKNEILMNLQTSDVFVPFLPKHFRRSKWVDQETRIAFASSKLIVPLQVDILPYGFIGKYQALKICKASEGESDFDLNETASKITSAIANDGRFKEKTGNMLRYSALQGSTQ